MTVLDVHPVGYGVAAEALGDEVATGVVTQGRRLTGTLSSCYGMAGTDDVGAAWAASYDSAAASAVATLRDLVGAGYSLAALLEQSAINYAAAEAACVSDETAAESAARWRKAFAPTLADLPSAVGGGVAAPSGWSMLAHLINRMWPNGHQDLLHRAADAWRTAGDGVRELVPAVDRATAAVREQRAPEVADAVTVLAGYRRQLASFADECTAIATSYADYAHHLDEAHSRIIHECVEFIDATVATELAGGLFVALTAGLSEAAAQGVVGAAAARAAEAIKAAISTLHVVALGVAADLDAATIRLAALSRDLRPTLSRTVQQSEVVRPGVAGQVPPMSNDPAVARLQARIDDWFVAGSTSQTWGNLRSLFRHFRDHGGDFGFATADDYARGAAAFRLRAEREHLPKKVDGGTIRYYDPRTNTFGSYRSDGRTRTFFKPDDGADYWRIQPGRQ